MTDGSVATRLLVAAAATGEFPPGIPRTAENLAAFDRVRAEVAAMRSRGVSVEVPSSSHSQPCGPWTVASVSDPARWMCCEGELWAADDETAAIVRWAEGSPVAAGSGTAYKPQGEHDQTWLYLAACAWLPGPLEITGTVPPLPDSPPAPPDQAG